MSIAFYDTTAFASGLIFDLLQDAYSYDPRYALCWRQNWLEADAFMVANPDIARRYSFVTVLFEEPIGFLVWDPRKLPAVAEIGHNCIRTRFQGNGYGKLQLSEAIRRIRLFQAEHIKVTTNESLHAARKNYESCGFSLVATRRVAKQPAFIGDALDYALTLPSQP